MREFIFGSALALVLGCGGGGGGSPSSTTPAPTVVENKAEAPPPPPPKQKTLDERADEMLEEMVAIFDHPDKDCDKFAGRLDAFVDKHKGDMQEMKDYEKNMSPERKEVWDQKTKQAMEKMMPIMTACATNEKVQAAMQRMSDQ